MKLAALKRKENVAEYILFMWQLTDLLRSLQFDSLRIRETLVDPLNLSADEAAKELAWYVEMSDIIQQEGKAEQGFIAITRYLIDELNEFHEQLLKEPTEETYRMLAFNATPAIVSFKEKVTEKLDNDLAYCFYALYSKLLLGLKNVEISKETQDSFTDITRLVAYLSKRFGQYERGEFAFSAE